MEAVNKPNRSVVESIINGLKDAAEGNVGRITTFSGTYKIQYEPKTDRLTITNTKTKTSDSDDIEDIREINDYEGVTLYQVRYTEDVFKIKIDSFWQKAFYQLLPYMFVVHFDMTQAKAIELAQCVKRL